MRWLGPGIVIKHEGRANVWISHRNAVVKAAGNYVRLAEVDEQLPWLDLYDSLRDTDEQTYFDLCPPGASRDPQYQGPSTSSDAPMTPIPVADESMPDAIVGEPDTSEIPVLPNSSKYAPVRNPRVRWRSDALELPTPQTASPAVSPQSVPSTTPPWPTPVPTIYETPPAQPPVTLRHGRSRTCPLVIQSFRRHLGSTKLHHRHQHPGKIFCLHPFVRRNSVTQNGTGPQKLRPFHLWQSGDPAHFILRTLYRNVGDPVRCIPRLLGALRPFRILRGKQPDPSEVSVKRPRLAPAQVMSTALAKSCDWSLGERGPVFGEINKDWRHSIFLRTCGKKRGSFCFRVSRESAFVAWGHGT